MTGLSNDKRRALTVWPGAIFALIGLNACIVGITVFAAASDPSVATEPDYYAKAVHFDDTIRQREANLKLGWVLVPTIRATATGGVEVVVQASDRDGKPVVGADVTTTAFASARSGARQLLTLREAPDTPGCYSSPIKIDRAGVWILRMAVSRGSEVFTRDGEVFMPVPDR